MLEMGSVTAVSKFDVRDLQAKKSLLSARAGGFEVLVQGHDIGIYRLSQA